MRPYFSKNTTNKPQYQCQTVNKTFRLLQDSSVYTQFYIQTGKQTEYIQKKLTFTWLLNSSRKKALKIGGNFRTCTMYWHIGWYSYSNDEKWKTIYAASRILQLSMLKPHKKLNNQVQVSVCIYNIYN